MLYFKNMIVYAQKIKEKTKTLKNFDNFLPEFKT